MKRDDKLKRGLAGLSNLPVQKGVAELRNKLLAGDPARKLDPETLRPVDGQSPQDKQSPSGELSPQHELSPPVEVSSVQIEQSPSPGQSPSIGHITPVDGYCQIPNTVFDRILPLLELPEQAVYLRLCRLTWGFRRDTCDVSARTLVSATNVKRSRLIMAVNKLVALGLVEREGCDFYAPNKERAQRYRVLPLPGGLRPSDGLYPYSGQSPRSGQSPSRGHMKTVKEKREEKAPVAPAPAPVLSVYDVRKIAARFVEAERGNSAYTKERLRSDVRRTLIGEGHDVEESLIDEAIGQ